MGLGPSGMASAGVGAVQIRVLWRGELHGEAGRDVWC
jgi:hypothetical protein